MIGSLESVQYKGVSSIMKKFNILNVVFLVELLLFNCL